LVDKLNTIFCRRYGLLKYAVWENGEAAQFEELSGEARYRLQKGRGAIFETVKQRISDSPPAKKHSHLTGDSVIIEKRRKLNYFRSVPPLQSTFLLYLFYPLQSMGAILRINHLDKRSVF